MLKDVQIGVSDGLLGLPVSTGAGVHVKIGASPVSSDRPITVMGGMSVSRIRELLGHSPLADRVMDSVDNGAGRIFCIPVAASSPGIITPVTVDNEGSGSVALEGSPTNAFDVIIKITAGGGLNEALFSCSLNGGHSFLEERTVPLSGVCKLEETGLSAKFSEGTDGISFAAGDRFCFKTTAPAMAFNDALEAINQLKNFNEPFELVHIAGESVPAFWSAVAAKQLELRDVHRKPLAFVLEAYAPAPDEDAGVYAARLEADRRAVRNCDVQVVAARSLYLCMDGVTREVNNAGVVCGLYARAAVHQSIGRTRESAGMAITRSRMLELCPAGIEDYIGPLDEAGYLMFRQYGGLEGWYVYNARMMSPEGSDYRYMEDVRVKNKIIRELRREGLKLLHDDVDLENQQAELESRAIFMASPLESMIDAGEISSARITVPEEQDIIATETMQVVVRYVSRGYIRQIAVDVGRSRA